MAEPAKQRHLANAPIIEAVIDLRVIPAHDLDPAMLSSIDAILSKRYPRKRALRHVRGTLEFQPGGVFTSTQDEGVQGFEYKSEDEKNVAQFRKDGFTCSRLKPYTEWGSLISEAKALWQEYVDLAKPLAISRLAVRYINRLDLESAADFDEYLTAGPRLPDTLSQELSHFLTRLVIQKSDMTATIIQALDQSPMPPRVGIILDIDVYKQRDVVPDQERIWQDFAELRAFKNDIFFGSITEKTVRLYE